MMEVLESNRSNEHYRYVLLLNHFHRSFEGRDEPIENDKDAVQPRNHVHQRAKRSIIEMSRNI